MMRRACSPATSAAWLVRRSRHIGLHSILLLHAADLDAEPGRAGRDGRRRTDIRRSRSMTQRVSMPVRWRSLALHPPASRPVSDPLSPALPKLARKASPRGFVRLWGSQLRGLRAPRPQHLGRRAAPAPWLERKASPLAWQTPMAFPSFWRGRRVSPPASRKPRASPLPSPDRRASPWAFQPCPDRQPLRAPLGPGSLLPVSAARGASPVAALAQVTAATS